MKEGALCRIIVSFESSTHFGKALSSRETNSKLFHFSKKGGIVKMNPYTVNSYLQDLVKLKGLENIIY